MNISIPLNCTACGLYRYRDCMVIGKGDIPAQILFIGEAPGMSEDTLGVPFCGISGHMFDIMLNDAFVKSGLKKFPTYYITNCVLCRPCDFKGGKNREPKPNEIIKCRDNLLQIIKTVKPQIAVLLGNIADKYCSELFTNAIKIQHPSYLLRDGGIEHPYYNRNIRILSQVFKELNI